MAIEFLFCEGRLLKEEEKKRKSLDQLLLEKGIFPHLDSLIAPRIIPVGGKTQITNFIKGYFSSPKVGDEPALNEYFAFRDRDFDLQLKTNDITKLHFPGSKRVAYLHRITIENYLINPESLYRFLSSQNGDLTKFGILVLDDVYEVMEEAATRLYYYTIARHTIGEIKINRPIVKSTWTKDSGHLPIDCSEMSCLKEINLLFQPSKDYNTTFDKKNIQSIFERNLEMLPENRYLNRSNPNDNFLTWSHGKDLITSIEDVLSARCRHNFTLGDKWWDSALESFNYANFPDLVELRNIINGTTPLEPLTT